MSQLNYENMVLPSLENIFSQCNSKLLDLELAETPDEGAIGKLIEKINKISEEIKKRTKIEQAPAEPAGKRDLKMSLQNQKELQTAIRDYVPTFQSGVDVHVFINALELYYTMYIAENPSAELEKMFVRLCTSKMSVEYGSTMTKFKPPIENFESMKSYLKTHHASKMSCYQTLDVMWDLQILESENLRDFARKLDEKAVESRNIIEAKFEASMKSKSAELKHDSEPDSTAELKMASKDVFQMLSGQIFLQMLKSKRPNVYNQIVNDLDVVWTAVDIANLAMSFEDRMAKDYSQNQATLTTSCTAESKPKKKPNKNFINNCWWYLNGNCNKDEKCNRNHDSNLKKSLDTAGLKMNKFGKIVSKDRKDEKPSGGGGNTQSLVATLNDQVFHE